MFRERFKPAVVAVFVAVLSLSVSANAATVLKSGDTVGGWTITFPSGISLIQDDSPGGVILKLEKGATFTSLNPLAIRFVQSSFDAVSEIAILNESVTNLSGQTWIGFDFLVVDSGLGNGGTAQFKSSSDVFQNISPFTSTEFSPSKVSLRGGSVADGETFQLGFDGATSGGDLIIIGAPSSPNGANGTFKTFDFHEVPIIPLPAAAWTGLSGLLGLGLIGYGKNLRRMLA